LSREGELPTKNPIGKVPCLVTDDGRALFDSPVICAYLDTLKAPALIPADANGRFASMTLEALADGLLDAGLLLRYEGSLRPEEKRWQPWIDGQMAKITGVIDALEGTYAEQLSGPLTMGQIAVACALGWFDFRFGHVDWRKDHPKVAAFVARMAERPSIKATVPA
jgi:glutathione S-transferase